MRFIVLKNLLIPWYTTLVITLQLVSEAIIMDKPQTDDAPSEEAEEASVEKETAK
jgi:hypothetical protein